MNLAKADDRTKGLIVKCKIHDDEFTVKVATTSKEIASLLETGFEYIITKEDLAYFRKRK